MAAVMIGVNPHKASHPAVAISAAGELLGGLRVRASGAQAERLLAWAAAWPERAWAVEGAGGVGHLLAQQLLAAGEHVLDVRPKLSARVRLLAAGATNKNDPDDARSVAVAALRSPSRRAAAADDHAAVLRVWSKRHRDLGRIRTQVVCRLHAVLCELLAGGVAGEITAGQAAQLLGRITPAGAVEAARRELATQFAEDLRRIDTQMRGTGKKLTAAVRASGTSLTGLFGAGPVIAAAVIGGVRDVSRFASRDHFAACDGTAPIEVSSGKRKIYRLSRRGNRRLNHAIHMAAVTQVRHRHSDGRACYAKKLAGGKTPKEAPRSLKRQISDAIFACLRADPAGQRQGPRTTSPGGQRGAALLPARPAHTPGTGSSGRPLRGLLPTLRPQRPGTPLPPHFPLRCHPARAGSRVQDRAEPGRAAAPAGRPRRGRPRAGNARGGKEDTPGPGRC